jgi:hypothetical protein
VFPSDLAQLARLNEPNQLIPLGVRQANCVRIFANGDPQGQTSHSNPDGPPSGVVLIIVLMYIKVRTFHALHHATVIQMERGT